MEDFSKYLGINRTFSLICCVFWIFSLAEGDTISEVVGNRVTLHCNNGSISVVSLLTWKMKGVTLFSFKPQKPLHISEEAVRLSINMSQSGSQLYALVIERVQKSHTGNYTCEINTDTGVWEQKWELIITEYEEAENQHKVVIAVSAAVPCVCCLIFIIVLTVLKRAHKRHAENNIHSRAAEMEKTEDIYENCLNQRRHNQPQNYNPRTH